MARSPHQRQWVFASLTALVLLPGGCGELRPPGAREEGVAVTYVSHIRPLLQGRCTTCHSGSSPAGSYDLSSYTGLLGPGTDSTRNVVLGDARSRLLTKLSPKNDPLHWAHLLPGPAELLPGETAGERRTSDLERLRTWVVQAKLAYFDVTVHPPTWVYPGDRTSRQFHGGALRAAGWSLDACRPCHGWNLTGDSSKGGGSCHDCHERGTEDCTVCHGSAVRGRTLLASSPPADLSWALVRSSRGVGAHQAHLASPSWFSPIQCAHCHRVPARTREAHHLFDDAARTRSDLRAEVTLSQTAALGGIKAAYDESSGSCTVYCHGAGLADRGKASTPSWTASLTPACDQCHAAPHKSPAYGGARCQHCHGQTVRTCSAGQAGCFSVGAGVSLAFIQAALHGDGKTPLGAAGAEGTCHGCHGSQSSGGAPGPDLDGSSDTSLVTVGLHGRHLAKGLFANAVSCADCHTLPFSLKDKGHMDSERPAEVTFSNLARGKVRSSSVDLKPAWDRSAATCSKVYCHGLDGGQVSQWSWTKQASPALSCTSCHGQPPAKTVTGTAHPGSLTCSSCHKSAYDSTGSLDPSRHINGKVDL